MLCTSPAPRVALLLHYRQVWLTLGNFFILSLPKELTTPATHLLVVPPLCRSSPSEPTALLPAPRCTVSKLLLPYLCPSLVASLFPRHVPNPPPPISVFGYLLETEIFVTRGGNSAHTFSHNLHLFFSAICRGTYNVCLSPLPQPYPVAAVYPPPHAAFETRNCGGSPPAPLTSSSGGMALSRWWSLLNIPGWVVTVITQAVLLFGCCDLHFSWRLSSAGPQWGSAHSRIFGSGGEMRLRVDPPSFLFFFEALHQSSIPVSSLILLVRIPVPDFWDNPPRAHTGHNSPVA